MSDRRSTLDARNGRLHPGVLSIFGYIPATTGGLVAVLTGGTDAAAAALMLLLTVQAWAFFKAVKISRLRVGTVSGSES
jgi:hypothetical protein